MLGATEATAVNLLVQIAESMSLTLNQMREGARLLASHTAEHECCTLTAEATTTLGQYRQAVHLAVQFPEVPSDMIVNSSLACAADQSPHQVFLCSFNCLMVFSSVEFIKATLSWYRRTAWS